MSPGAAVAARRAGVAAAIALACVGCAAGGATRRRAFAGAPVARPGAGAALCRDADVDAVFAHGFAGDRTWVLGRARDDRRGVLAALAGDGSLRLTTVASDADRARPLAHFVGSRVWVLRGAEQDAGGAAASLVAYDVAGGEARAGAPRRLAGLPTGGVAGFAVEGDRALLWASARRELDAWDLAGGRRVGAPAALAHDDPLDAPALRCARDGCFALAVEGSGAPRRLVSRRVDRDGRASREVLADEHAMSWTSVDLDADRVLALWTVAGGAGVRARALDRAGRTRGAAATLRGGPASEPRDVVAVRGPRGAYVAWKELGGAGRWVLATLSDDGAAAVDPVAVPLPDDASFLLAAAGERATLATGFDNSVLYTGLHAWTSSAAYALVPHEGAVPAAFTPLASASGDGRGGRVVYPLAAPSGFAVLVTPYGSALDSARACAAPVVRL